MGEESQSRWDVYCGEMVIPVPSVARGLTCQQAARTLEANADWPGLAILSPEGGVTGYLGRKKLLELLSKPLMADLYNRRPVELIMDSQPLVVDQRRTLDSVCAEIAASRGGSQGDGFVIADQGRYVGLGDVNTMLAATVRQAQWRAACLAREKEEAERALAQLHLAHAALNKVNRHISESIHYASRIQTSLLPDYQQVEGLLYDLAVGWAPRDVVGGDIYWIGRFGERCVLAVMDCTGHGVPGAFMTAIVASVLDRILHEHCHDDPAMILQLLNRLVKTSLRQDGDNGNGSDDGLDAAICLIDTGRRSLTFAGANIPLIIADDSGLRLLKGDRHSLGYRTSRADYLFTNHVLTLEPGMTFYLFTDGVSDQIGGEKHRLFGRRRVLGALAEGQGLPLEQQMNNLFLLLSEYRGAEARRDDMTFIGFTPLRPPASRWVPVGDGELEKA